METRFEHGTAFFGTNQFDGNSVSQLLENGILGELLNLSGSESVEVRSADATGFTAVTGSYIVQAGDTVVFRQATGGKGA
jgi:hypothetical protein